MHADTLLLRWKEAIPWELTVRELTACRYLTEYKVCTQTSHLCFICLRFPVKPLRKGLIKKVVKKKVRERGSTTDMVLYNITYKCNTSIISAIPLSTWISTEVRYTHPEIWLQQCRYSQLQHQQLKRHWAAGQHITFIFFYSYSLHILLTWLCSPLPHLLPHSACCTAPKA